MSQSPPAKRRKSERDANEPVPKRKVTSCETCRRLKTRCEIRQGAIICHRCGILKLECSLAGAETTLKYGNQTGQQGLVSYGLSCEENTSLDQRMLAVEQSLAHVRTSLDELTRSSDKTASNNYMARSNTHKVILSSHLSRATTPQNNGPLVADRNSRTAPASLIRDMKHYILGEEREWQKNDASEDIVTKGIVTEELTHSLLVGFSKLSRRWLFMKSEPSAVRNASSILFASCVLAGLQINPSLHGSQLHHDLYQHVSELVSKAMLSSPLSLESIQSMLVFSMWNLVPDKNTEHLDPWLLSGVAGMQGMLAINFEQLLKPQIDGVIDSKSRETLRSWNFICLCHLQFSVGTGRPPVLSRQYLKQCKNILSLPSYTTQDKMVALGVELYDSLCSVCNADIVQTHSLTWEEIDDWKKRCGSFFELDSTKPLRFAYSCSYLILTRRTLKYLSDQPAKESSKDSDLDPSLYFQLAIEHAHRILHLFLAMSDLTAFVRPAYENLLCSFAMVTLSEFATYLDDVHATLALMERTSRHVQLGGKAEPVSKWALSVMRKYVYDMNKSSDIDIWQAVAADTVVPRSAAILPAESFEVGGWGSADPTYQVFPSLEEMFLGN
ncbi:hypothetical protein P280DRAFT_553703 [Massarina eburnea CBS 473.64]|uniref:Transcriptional activator of proteases prtT n=1 Tax=Massarina eburnea CBS 473.64 TaxID=1395130 RepID=A0A6A6RKF8_9PLEO|nr:hypothetical protein P280DRAFT_553703 [Massarina eburnea CBS 473.64]